MDALRQGFRYPTAKKSAVAGRDGRARSPAGFAIQVIRFENRSPFFCMNWFVHTIRFALVHWGYLALGAGLLAEDAGVPVPGETTLMLAAFLAHKTGRLSIGWVIVVGIIAAILGDNLGFLIGRWIGPRFLGWLTRKFHIGEEIAVARDQIEHHGGATVFWARYIFGLRTICGPVAGALDMQWRWFFICNALGGVTWVTAIAMIGYGFAGEFHSFLGYLEKASWGVAGAIFAVGYLLWRRAKRRYHDRVEAGTVSGSR